jgi:hypothetical protein
MIFLVIKDLLSLSVSTHNPPKGISDVNLKGVNKITFHLFIVKYLI